MTNLLDLLGAGDAAQPASLRELRLWGEPATIVLFTADCDHAFLHYELGPEMRGDVVCPGAGCPYCYIGSSPKKCGLLPVFNIESAQIEVLRVPVQAGVGSLAAAVMPVLKRKDLASCVVVLVKRSNAYEATVRPLGDGVDNGAAAIERYVALGETRPKLDSVFLHPTAGEIAALDRVRRKLAAFPDYKPPTTA